MVMGGGFVVTDCSQRTLFKVDGCGVVGKMGEVVLSDAHGLPLFLLQRKVRRILGFESDLILRNQTKSF